MVHAFRLLKMPLFIGFLKILREKNKIYSNDDKLEEELLQYIKLNKKRIDYVVIKEFKNKLTTSNKILRHENKINEIKKLSFKKRKSKRGIKCIRNRKN